MSDIDTPNRSSSLSWSIKLTLTVIAGGTLAGWTFWRFSSTYNNPLQSAFALHIATIFLWAFLIAATLCLFDGYGWRNAAAKGSLLALVASVVIAIAAVLLLLLMVLLVDQIIH